ncbi:hypothetical protein IWW36_004534 [Coemansia brasiliensis]|uniref:Uncharacterized protein n=1 Tax=Coemansia brasiliensis TaxID=2650707 RepID=A0A9W8I3E3_9FUNG|nr:hypothetical protein IWW36_004534 [Coemansia brasiliensis]
MTGSSLAELKKRQQQRRQQQTKASGTKRKRELIAHSQQQPTSNSANRFTTDAGSKALAQKIRSSGCASPFAASLRALKDDPFDIINHDILNHQNIYLSSQGSDTLVATSANEDYEDSNEQVVVVTADFSDSEGENDDIDSNYECDLNENDPSLYKLTPAVATIDNDMMQIDDTSSDNKISGNTKKSTQPPESTANKPLVFSKPPESLSFCTHISITCDLPLDSLEPLRESSSLLSMTSLCTSNSSSINSIADSLVYWELHSGTNVTEEAMKQSFASVFDLQLKAPEKYPFIYLKLRDFTVAFKILQARRCKGGACRRVAVINCSHRGMRKLLNEQNVEFSLPLAPQIHTWSEIPGAHEKSTDIHRLHSSSIDKTPKSALLVMGNDNVDGLLGYIMSTSFKSASLYSTSPFVNATMRQCTLRFTQVTTYVNDLTGQQLARQLHKLDISGVVLPNAWSLLVRALADILGPYTLSFKESQEMAHLNMLVSKQASAVAGKRSISYEPKQGFMYS